MVGGYGPHILSRLLSVTRRLPGDFLSLKTSPFYREVSYHRRLGLLTRASKSHHCLALNYCEYLFLRQIRYL